MVNTGFRVVVEAPPVPCTSVIWQRAIITKGKSTLSKKVEET
jgi:hypothetical protein